MNYKVTMFHATWEIRTNVPVDSRIVAYGPYPNDLGSVTDLMDRLKQAVQANSDGEVKTIMGDWAK